MQKEAAILNSMLSIIGIAFTEGADFDHPFAPQAKNLINAVRRQFASSIPDTSRSTWWFNTETVTLYPAQGVIFVPDDFLRVDVLDPEEHCNAIKRGDRMYNRRDESFTFDEPLTCLVVRDLPLEETPEAFQSLVEAECCRRFAIAPANASGAAAHYAQMVEVALAQLRQEDDSQKPANVLTMGDGPANMIWRACNARRGR